MIYALKVFPMKPSLLRKVRGFTEYILGQP